MNNTADFLQNIANLFYLPRVPVYVPTNSLGSNDFRFYLDLNRNAKFEDSGAVPAFGPNGLFLHPNGVEDNNQVNVLTNFQAGDPQWIGVLERPDAPHGPNNKFLARYAFIALPADGALDLNAIHNQALHGNNATVVNPPPAGDVYFRNQGAGSWEINLAAFLADLNTNEWGQIIGATANGNSTYYYYQYNPNNAGTSFDDARSLLAYRYNNFFGTLSFLPTLFPYYPLAGGPVDILPFGFPIGQAMNGTGVPFYNYNLNKYWPGADTPITSSPYPRICTIQIKRDREWHRLKLPPTNTSPGDYLMRAPTTPPTIATRFTGCCRNSARIPRRTRAR